MSSVKVQRSTALAIFTFCGWKSADKWNNERMSAKLLDVRDVLPSEQPPEAIAATIVDIVSALETSGGAATFEVVDDIQSVSVNTTAAASSAVPAVTEATTESVAAAEAASKPAKPPKEPKAPKPPKEPKAPKPPKEPKPAPGPKRPKERNSRVYCAGLVIKEFGLDHPITNEMAVRVDQLCGNPNTKESMAWLQVAWHVVNAVLGTYVPAKEETPAKESAAEAPAA